MRITTKGRYAVMAMADLASLGDDAAPVSLYEISDRLDIKLNYLEQIFHKLKKNNLVNAVKGPGGGYYLSSEMANVKIIDIINAVNEPITMTRCSKESRGCAQKGAKCLTHNLWQGLSNKISSYLSGVNLQDIVHNKEDKFYGK